MNRGKTPSAFELVIRDYLKAVVGIDNPTADDINKKMEYYENAAHELFYAFVKPFPDCTYPQYCQEYCEVQSRTRGLYCPKYKKYLRIDKESNKDWTTFPPVKRCSQCLKEYPIPK